MFHLLRQLLFIAILIVVIAFLGRNFLIAKGFAYYVGHETGFKFKVESVDFSRFVPSIIRAYHITAENPPGYPVADGITISRAEVRLPFDFWKNLDHPRIEYLNLSISEINIVVEANGMINTQLLDDYAQTNSGQIYQYPFVGELELSVEKVILHDGFGGDNYTKPVPSVVIVDIKNARFKNIQNLAQLERLVLREALKKTHFPGLEKYYKAYNLELQ